MTKGTTVLAVVFLVIEALCVLSVAIGVGWAIHPGWGLVVGGLLGLVLAVAAQIPDGSVG